MKRRGFLGVLAALPFMPRTAGGSTPPDRETSAAKVAPETVKVVKIGGGAIEAGSIKAGSIKVENLYVPAPRFKWLKD